MTWLYTFLWLSNRNEVPLELHPQLPEARGSVGESPVFGDFWHVVTKIMLFKAYLS